jgi:hypothetical protein
MSTLNKKILSSQAAQKAMSLTREVSFKIMAATIKSERANNNNKNKLKPNNPLTHLINRLYSYWTLCSDQDMKSGMAIIPALRKAKSISSSRPAWAT